MPKPIKTVDRFFRAVEETVRRGYEYDLYSTPVTATMRLPNDLRRFGTLYWQSSQTSYYTPIQVVAFELYRSDVWTWNEAAASAFGMSDHVLDSILKAVYPYRGYSKRIRKQLLQSASCW